MKVWIDYSDFTPGTHLNKLKLLLTPNRTAFNHLIGAQAIEFAGLDVGISVYGYLYRANKLQS